MMVEAVILDLKILYDQKTDCLVEECLPLLERLRGLGIKLCLVTKENKEGETRTSQISRLGISRYFDFILIVYEEKKEEDFQRCLAELLLRPHQAVIVGDSIEKEIYPGNKTGMITVWYAVGQFASAHPETGYQKPDIIITKLEDLIGCLMENYPEKGGDHDGSQPAN
jgi:FMN phosphatase YigB (HAD superfamily)